MTPRKSVTSKLFYQKWAYKIDCICPGSYMIKRQGVARTLAYCLEPQDHYDPWRRHVDKKRLMLFLTDVEQFIDRKDLQIRTESGHFTIFCSDPALFKSLKLKLDHWIREIWEPGNEVERDFIVDNGSKKVLCNELPYSIYNYRVFLRNNISVNTKESFQKWQKNYIGKIGIPKGVQKWLISGQVWASSPYIYVSDSATLSMVGLFLGNSVLRVEQFIPRSSINILIDQEQPCPV